MMGWVGEVEDRKARIGEMATHVSSSWNQGAYSMGINFPVEVRLVT